MLTFLRNIRRTAVHPVTFVVLCLLWCLDLGSLLAYERPDIFGSMDACPFALWLREVGRRALPWSARVYLLAVLIWAMTGSLLLCTVSWFWRRRRSLRGLGAVRVHLGFLLIFGGFVVEAMLGTRVHGIAIAEGGSAPVPALGLTPRLERVELSTSPAGAVVDSVSTISPGRDGAWAGGTTRLNHALIEGATVVYPRGTQEMPTRRGPLLVGRQEVHRDPGVRFVLAGAVPLFAGTLWAFATHLAAPRLAPAASPVSSSGA